MKLTRKQMSAIVKINGVEKKRVWVDELAQVVLVDSPEFDADVIKALKSQWKDHSRKLEVIEMEKKAPKKGK